MYLLIICNNVEGISFKDLTNLSGCDKGMTTKVVTSLKNKDLVIFDDKKYFVTDKGKELEDNVVKVFYDFKAKLFNKIDINELTIIFEDLIKLEEILRGEIEC